MIQQEVRMLTTYNLFSQQGPEGEKAERRKPPRDHFGHCPETTCRDPSMRMTASTHQQNKK
jgi:hypothetical protein